MRDSFRDIIQLFDEVESMMTGFWEFNFPALSMTWSPATDVFVAGSEVYVIVELPGVARKELKVAISPVMVEVSGVRPTPEFFNRGTNFYELEIPHGVFRKRITLPCRVEPKKIKATLKDGLFTLRLPRAAAEPALPGRKAK